MDRVTWQRPDLVPLAQRLRYLHVFRVVALACTVLWSANARVPQVASVGPVELGATAAYLVAGLGVGLVTQRSGRAARWLFGASLLLDGLAMIAAIQLHGGLASPLRYLPLLHLVMVTLVASHRTGVKLAIWHSLLLLVRHESVQVGLLANPGAEELTWQVTTQLVVLWLTTLVAAAASAVNEREILRRRYDLDALARMAEELESASDVHAVAGLLVEHVADTFQAPRAAVVSLQEGDPLTLAGRGVTPATSSGAITGVLARAAEARRPILVSELGDDDRWLAQQLDDARHLTIVPLVTEGDVHDVLVVEHGHRVGARIERRVVQTLARFASHGALALRNARLHAELVALAQTDGLTGAANRSAFDRALAAELARAERNGGRLALLLCDLDHFKQVNDQHGHQTGDAVLSWIAAELQLGSREYDLVARFGGEEFAVVMPATDLDAATHVAERLRTTIEEGASPVPVTVSIGVAAAQGSVASADLLRAADEALYDAKHAGRNRVARHPALGLDGRGGS